MSIITKRQIEALILCMLNTLEVTLEGQRLCMGKFGGHHGRKGCRVAV